MSKGKKQKTIILPIVFAIVSVIAICMIAFISNSTIVRKEAIGKVVVGEKASSTTLQTGKVVVKYVDTEGEELAEETTLTGIVGSEYKAVRKDIATYAPYGIEPYNKAGNYTTEAQTVTFVYEKDNSSIEVSEEFNRVTVNTYHSRNAKEYDVKIITKNEEGSLIKTMSYKVTSGETTIREGKVVADNFVVGTLTIASEGSDTYKIEEDSGEYYVKLEDRPIEFTITKTWNPEISDYDATLSYASDYKGVTITKNDEDSTIIVEIINGELNGKNVFDLRIQKDISKVVVKEDGTVTNEYTVKENDKGEIVKVDVAKSKLNKTKLEITYKITVENVGNIPGYAKEIVDYLPENFKYLSGSKWVIDGNNAITTELEDVLLNAGDKKELEITVEWDLNEKSVGLKENKVEITDYENEIDLDDKTPDNVDTESIIATVKTGGAEMPAGIILITLNAIVIAVYVIKRNRREK